MGKDAEDGQNGRDLELNAVMLPLKHGEGHVSYVVASVFTDGLRFLSEKHPEHFEALMAIAKGNDSYIDPESQQYLESQELIRDGKIVSPIIASILRASHKETPDGICVVNPFEVRNEADAETFRTLEKRNNERNAAGWRRLAERLLDREPER